MKMTFLHFKEKSKQSLLALSWALILFAGIEPTVCFEFHAKNLIESWLILIIVLLNPTGIVVNI